MEILIDRHNKIAIYNPAMTMVDEYNNKDTGVEADIA